MIKASEYIKTAKRTEPSKTYKVSSRIEHGVFGLVTESGELMDAVKKAKFYGNKIDKVNLIEEVGDVMWYLAILCDELNVSFEEVWDKNIRKLEVRFPKKFTKDKALKRTLSKERKELEK